MIVILDTNVLVSGVFFGGAPDAVLKRWADGAFELAVSPSILDEYTLVILRLEHKYGLDAGTQTLKEIKANALTVPDKALPEQVCKDPTDDKFLSCAIESGAKMVVSGDRLLRQTDGYRGISVIGPTALLKQIG